MCLCDSCLRLAQVDEMLARTPLTKKTGAGREAQSCAECEHEHGSTAYRQDSLGGSTRGSEDGNEDANKISVQAGLRNGGGADVRSGQDEEPRLRQQQAVSRAGQRPLESGQAERRQQGERNESTLARERVEAASSGLEHDRESAGKPSPMLASQEASPPARSRSPTLLSREDAEVRWQQQQEWMRQCRENCAQAVKAAAQVCVQN